MSLLESFLFGNMNFSEFRTETILREDLKRRSIDQLRLARQGGIGFVNNGLMRAANYDYPHVPQQHAHFRKEYSKLKSISPKAREYMVRRAARRLNQALEN